MSYSIRQCPRCYLRPVDDHDLPASMAPEEKLAVVCKHCGAKLWAVAQAEAAGGPLRIMFHLREDDA